MNKSVREDFKKGILNRMRSSPQTEGMNTVSDGQLFSLINAADKAEIYEEALKEIADLDNPDDLSRICSPTCDYMEAARQALSTAAKIGGEG